MSKLFKALKAGLEEAIAHDKGKLDLHSEFSSNQSTNCSINNTALSLDERQRLAAFFSLLIQIDQREKEEKKLKLQILERVIKSLKLIALAST